MSAQAAWSYECEDRFRVAINETPTGLYLVTVITSATRRPKTCQDNNAEDTAVQAERGRKKGPAQKETPRGRERSMSPQILKGRTPLGDPQKIEGTQGPSR